MTKSPSDHCACSYVVADVLMSDLTEVVNVCGNLNVYALIELDPWHELGLPQSHMPHDRSQETPSLDQS